jgi:hypothetical protein
VARLEAPYTRTRSAFDERRIDSDTSVGRFDVAIVVAAEIDGASPRRSVG